MRYVSLFTGIGGFDLALDRAGHIGLAMVEKDKACQNVLRKRFPNVLLHDDVMTFGRKDVHGTVDIVAGGSPCQAFSVAGLRQSLCDHRGNLAFEFIRICNELQPKYVIWENVPGVLSTRDNAFGCFLAGLVGEDTPLVPAGGKWTNTGVVAGPQRSAAWRILDAQYFGVAQRRRRVFVVASAASAERSCIEILFEREGVRRDSPPSREARESVAGTVAEGIGANDTVGALQARDFKGIGEQYVNKGKAIVVKVDNTKSNGWGVLDDGTTHSLGGSTDAVVYDARGKGEGDTAPDLTGDHMGNISDYTPVVIGPLRSNAYNNSDPTMEAQQLVIQQNTRDEVRLVGGDGQIVGALSSEAGMKQQNYVVSLDSQLNADEEKIDPLRSFAQGGTTGQVVVQQNAVGDPDVSNGVDTKVRHDYDNQVGTAIVAFTARDSGGDAQEDVTPTLRSLSYTNHQAGSHGVAIAYDRIDRWVDEPDKIRAIQGDGHSSTAQEHVYFKPESVVNSLEHGRQTKLISNATVRRLTPLECERLQAFPDDWTNIPQADTPRYKQLGNAVCVNVVEWIVRRI